MARGDLEEANHINAELGKASQVTIVAPAQIAPRPAPATGLDRGLMGLRLLRRGSSCCY